MQTLLVDLKSGAKAKELCSVLSSMNFVKKVSMLSNAKPMMEALQTQEDSKKAFAKKKNKAIERYL
jgi:hypothetical protein